MNRLFPFVLLLLAAMPASVHRLIYKCSLFVW